MFVVVNPYAGGGRGIDRWNTVSPLISRTPGRYAVRVIGPACPVRDAIRAALEAGERQFVAAGGDGTVNALLNALASMMTPEALRDVTIGAVGLGSSNDVHKPYASTLAGLPVRLDFDRAVPTDIGCLALGACRRFFLVNASAGITAEANAFFNRPDAALRLLKTVSTPAAIAYAALRTISRHDDVPATITSDGRELKDIGLSNIAILKSPHFSGDLRFPEGADPGRFSIYLQHAFGRRELAGLMMGLRRGNCAITERSLHWHASDVSIKAFRPFPVEYDGETLMTTSVHCSVCLSLLRICP